MSFLPNLWVSYLHLLFATSHTFGSMSFIPPPVSSSSSGTVGTPNSTSLSNSSTINHQEVERKLRESVFQLARYKYLRDQQQQQHHQRLYSPSSLSLTIKRNAEEQRQQDNSVSSSSPHHHSVFVPVALSRQERCSSPANVDTGNLSCCVISPALSTVAHTHVTHSSKSMDLQYRTMPLTCKSCLGRVSPLPRQDELCSNAR